MIKGTRSGIFFCAVIGAETDLERTYVRFVPANQNWKPVYDANEIEKEIGTCLRLIECDENTPLWHPGRLKTIVYAFWEVAREDIWQTWMQETDPANLQPKIRPLNHRVAEFVRSHMPSGISTAQTRKVLDILESPWPRREEMMLREWFDAKKFAGEKLAKYLIDKVLETGIEATPPPLPIPPIDVDDVDLFYWIGIKSEQTDKL